MTKLFAAFTFPIMQFISPKKTGDPKFQEKLETMLIQIFMGNCIKLHMGSLKVANVMDTVYHVCDASGKSNLMLSRDFITINDVISFKFRCLQKKLFT